MKSLPYILGGIAASAIAFFVIRPIIPPAFSIEMFDNVSKSGEFLFGGNRNTFSFSGGGSASARSGWVATYGMKGAQFSFDLFHNGTFVKNLAVL